MLTGRAEQEAFDDVTFEENFKRFRRFGEAVDPDSLEAEDGRIKRKESGLSVFGNDKKVAKKIKTGREKKGDSSVLEGEASYKGPWARYSESEPSSSQPSEDETASEEESEEEEQKKVLPAVTIPVKETPAVKEWSEFVGTQEYDYLGRTYFHVPQDLDVNLRKEPGSQETFVPKKKIHTWAGHTGGVNALRFLPYSGHLLLSGGNDTLIKIWDCHRNNRELLRVFHGHDKAVKDVSFNGITGEMGGGTQFLSAAYDRTIKLWDTETGKVVQRYTNLGRKNSARGNSSMANCVRFNPEADKQTQFLSAMADNTILQWDTRLEPKDAVVQTYDHHLGPVNSITFVDNDRRFMTTSDDRTVRVWDWQINVPIKFIADPTQQAMPTTALHPSGKFVAAQSMDNRILVFGALDKSKFRQNRKKEFTGHSCAGYPIQVAFSPDGKYLMSGDARGHAYFWDWKTCAPKGRLKVSGNSANGTSESAVITCIAAHPQESSKVAVAGKDSVITYWD